MIIYDLRLRKVPGMLGIPDCLRYSIILLLKSGVVEREWIRVMNAC
jgi:hypothetical protein